MPVRQELRHVSSPSKWGYISACPAGQHAGHAEQGVVTKCDIEAKYQLGASYMISFGFDTNYSAEMR